VLIGMGAILLNRCVIGSGSIVGADALVAEGVVVPPGSLVVGVPGKVIRATTDEQRAGIARSGLTCRRLADALRAGAVRYHGDV
jgi:carbonic anhydrase/acetyltransferase-like protein (isoleucine patch superfamily)